ncbi:MAG: penicillin-binding protein 2, partial [Gammaproteobacteria bacterium]|nr:penicillin-binding protein 2 [Gammaproteobacteria bacterium]
ALAISIDKRLQYVAYRELKAAVQTHGARAGSIVVMDPLTGEVLAMVNQPSFNPNNRRELKGQNYRNRAVTDIFEPGSTAKPFTVAAALESGAYSPNTRIDTSPGVFMVGGHTVQDARNNGVISVKDVLVRSSNVGASKIALSLEPQLLWNMFDRLGFGRTAGSGFPGEASGRLHSFYNWREIEQATLSFGYGMSVSALHLTRAYAAIANDGMLPEVVLVKSAAPAPASRAMSVSTSRTLRRMLRQVVESGTGRAARVPGYTVAGKTGTVHKADGQGYAEHRYLSLFVGMLPATRPRLVAFVVLDEPSGGEYYGGKVAAPVFARLMHEATRILNIPPDNARGGDTSRVIIGAAPNPALAVASEPLP